MNISWKGSFFVTNPAYMVGVLTISPNFKAMCGRTNLFMQIDVLKTDSTGDRAPQVRRVTLAEGDWWRRQDQISRKWRVYKPKQRLVS